jgi:hypothetical protein
MDLKEFVSKTLIEITEGVISAQESLKEKGAIVVPADLHVAGEASTRPGGYFGRSVQTVQFNVGLIIQENNEGKGGIGVATGFFKAGGEKGSSTKNESTTNVSFSVPIAFPEGNQKQRTYIPSPTTF